MTVDPLDASAKVGNPSSWNRYAYVEGDPVNLTDPDGRLPIAVEGNEYRVVWQPVWNGEDFEYFEYKVAYVGPMLSRSRGKPFRLQLWEQYVEESGLSETCARGLVTAGKTPISVQLGNGAKSILQSAAEAEGVDWRLIAAIGVMETGFMNIWQKDNKGRDMIGHGAGVFQIDLSKNPNVSEKDAFNIASAADWAANRLSSNYA